MGKIRGMALEKCGLIWSPLERRNTLRRTWLRKSGPDYYGGLWREHAGGYASCFCWPVYIDGGELEKTISFWKKAKGEREGLFRTKEYITRRIVLPDDTINRRKAKGHGICADRRALGAAHCFNRTLENNRQCLENGKQEKGFQHLPEPLPLCIAIDDEIYLHVIYSVVNG